MNIIKNIKHELNYLKGKDIKAVFVFLLSLLPSLIFCIVSKISKRKIWLICEDEKEARDNGFCFFKYLCENTEVEAIYAIDKLSNDFSKVSCMGKTVNYGSILHWMYYFASEYNISTQKAGKPNAAVGYVLERMGICMSKFIFLQHGITINKAEWLFYRNTKMRLFVCGAKPEFEYVRELFGYPEKNIAYLGFSRFDDYVDCKPNRKQILLMPSWREWIGSKNEYSSIYEEDKEFKHTEYYRKYQSLINNPVLQQFLVLNDLELYFYPHRNMQQFLGDFSCKCRNIKIVGNKNCDIRKLLIESALMITDYSSVALDFAYMKKPVIFYQFDEKKFHQAQYAEGFFDYRKSGLGLVVEEEAEVVGLLKVHYRNNYHMNEEFMSAHKDFFPLCDCDNSKRIYDYLMKIRNGEAM